MNNNLNQTSYKPNYENKNNDKFFIGIVIGIIIGLIIGILIAILSLSIVNKTKEETKPDKSYSSESTNTNTNTTTTNNNNNNNSHDDVSMFVEIDKDGLINLYNGPERSVIYIGRATCGYCVKFLPALQRAQSEFGYQTYYYDIDKLTADDYYEIVALNLFLEENFGSTPMVLVVQNGQILSESNDNTGWIGYAEYDQFQEYLKNLGF